MCRNIRTLFNFEPPVTTEEVRAASLQFVRKISGFTQPSHANEAPFLAAVDRIAAIAESLLRSLATNAPPKNRAAEAEKAKARAAIRFGPAAFKKHSRTLSNSRKPARRTERDRSRRERPSGRPARTKI